MRKVKSYNCPECGKRYKTLTGWGDHMEKFHPDSIPEGFSIARYFYYVQTGMTQGKCVTCKGPTQWNESTMKYNRYCDNPKCKEAYCKIAKQRMIDKYGKVHLLNDPEQQKKMMEGRKISGTYAFQDGVKFKYVGSYEKNFLEMLNTFMNWPSNDLYAPSPHTYYYEAVNPETKEKEKHFYIPDFYIPSINLEIEIKQQTSTNDAYNKANKPKEHLKDEIMKNNNHVNYIKVNDNDFSTFFQFLMEYKESIPEPKDEKIPTPLFAMEAYEGKPVEDDTPQVDTAVPNQEAPTRFDIIKRWEIPQGKEITHTCVQLDGDDRVFRARSEMIIVRDDEILVNFKSSGDYSLPGGTWEKGESPKDAAIRECQEEVRMNVKDIEYGGDRIWIYDEPTDWMKKEIDPKYWWNGCYCQMYIGKLNGTYTGYIKSVDRDGMIRTAKFYKINEIFSYLKPEHQRMIEKYYGKPKDQAQITMESVIHPACECFGACNRLNYEKSNCKNCPHGIEDRTLGREDIIQVLRQFPESPDDYVVAGHAVLVLKGLLPTMEPPVRVFVNDYATILKYKELGQPVLTSYRGVTVNGLLEIKHNDTHLIPAEKEKVSGFFVETNKSLIRGLSDNLPRIAKKRLDSITNEYLINELNQEMISTAAMESTYSNKTKFKDPKDLSKWMIRHIRYSEYTRLMSHDEVYMRRKGSCHDQCVFEVEELRRMGYHPQTLFFVEYAEGNPNGGVTHSLVIFYKGFDICWFENAWEGQRGIHKFKTLFDLKKKIHDLHKSGKFGDYEQFPNLQFSLFDIDDHDVGEDLNTYVNICLESDSTVDNVPATEEAIYSAENKYPVFIVLQHSGTTMANVIKKFTRDEFSHACISFNSDLAPLYSFGNKKLKGYDAGFVIHQDGPKNKFYSMQKVYYSVYVMYVTKGAYDAMQKRLSYFVQNKDTLKYDFVNLLTVWAGLPSEKSKKYFCSRFVMDIIASGKKLEKKPSQYKPQDIADIEDISLVNHGSDFRLYSQKLTEMNLLKVQEGRYNEIVTPAAESVMEPTVAMEGLFTYLKNKIAPVKSWESILFQDKSLMGKPIFTPYTGASVKDGLIEVRGINYHLLQSRIARYYVDKSIYNLFIPKYNAISYRKFERKRIQRSDIKIDYLYTEEFFALELATLFTELGKRFRDKNYKKIAKQIYDNTWLSQADKKAEETPLLSTAPVKNLELTLNDYQEDFIQKYPKLKAQLNLNGYILAFEQGLGKTLTAIALAECLKVDHVYIVCPNSLKENWALEIRKYFKKYDDEDTWRQEVFICSDREIYFSENRTKYMIINNESIQKMYPYVMSGKNMLIVDEAHNFRNLNSKRVDQLLKLRDMLKCSDTLVMSGTPIKAAPSEIVPSLLLIDPTFSMNAAVIFSKAFKLHDALGTSLIQNRFGKTIYRKEKDVLGDKLPAKNIDQIVVETHDAMKYTLESANEEVMSRFSEIYDSGYKEFLSLKKPFVDMSKKYAPADLDVERFLRIIEVLVRKSKAELHEIDLMYAENGMKKILQRIKKKADRDQYDFLIKNYVRYRAHCLGVAFGQVLPPYRRDMYISMYDENRNQFFKMIKENPKKTLIFTQFKGVAEFIYKSLNDNDIGAVMINGDVKNRMEILREFKENPSILVLVATSQTIGTGVTLTEANQMLFFGPPWRESDFQQCSDRIHRIGQTDDCYIYTVVLQTGDAANLSTRMDDILKWSKRMTDAAISRTEDSEDIDQSHFKEVLTATESALLDEFLGEKDESQLNVRFDISDKLDEYITANEMFTSIEYKAKKVIPKGSLLVKDTSNNVFAKELMESSVPFGNVDYEKSSDWGLESLNLITLRDIPEGTVLRLTRKNPDETISYSTIH